MANQQLALEIVAKDLATATLQKVDAALLDVARRQGSVTAATNSATTSTGEFSRGLNKAGNALNNMAGDLLGVNNKVANMAEGLLQFAGGGVLVTSVALGITAVAAAVKFFRVEVASSLVATDDLAKRWASAFEDMRRKTREGLEQERALLQQRFTFLSTIYITNRSEAIKNQLAETAAGLQAISKALDDLNKKATGPAAPLIGTDVRKVGDITGKLGREAKGPAEPLGLRLGGDFTTMIPEVQQAGTVFTDFADTLDLIVFRMGAISDATAGIAEGFAALGDVVGGGIGNVAKKVLAPFMKLEGTYFVIKGLAKLADGLFPPNPALIASGSGMVARGRQLLSMAGGGTPGGGSGSGGGSAAGGATRDVQDATRRGTVTITMREGFVSTRDPRWQEELAETIRNAAGRNIVFNMVPA